MLEASAYGLAPMLYGIRQRIVLCEFSLPGEDFQMPFARFFAHEVKRGVSCQCRGRFRVRAHCLRSAGGCIRTSCRFRRFYSCLNPREHLTQIEAPPGVRDGLS